MNQATSTRPEWISEVHHPLEPLRIVTLYDTHLSLLHAERMVAALTEAAGSPQRIKHASWNFNMLTRLDVRHASAAVAAETDILVVAADASALVPQHVKSWIEEALRNNTKGPPLVIGLYGSSPHGAKALSAFHSDLLSAARYWNIPPLFNSDFDSQIEWRHWAAYDDHHAFPSSRSIPHSPLTSSHIRRGGINE
jgi:hypothetical protein